MVGALIVQVECYSDAAYADRPLVVVFEGKRLIVKDVISAERIPTGRRFRVRLDNGRETDLYYAEAEDHWTIPGSI
jgi:hypothetical protein